MLEITKRNLFIYKNVWFPDDSSYPPSKCDICCLIGVPNVHKESISSVKYSTLITDLTLSKEEILEQIGHHTMKEIRRSDKDNFEIKQHSSEELLSDRTIIDDFVKMYVKNYQLKGLKAIDPTEDILHCAKFDGCVITEAKYNGISLAYHVCVVDENNARSWISTSCFRDSDDGDFKRIVGRANKRLRYEDIFYFKSIGKKKYDFGGISSYDNPNGIDQLKMSFGGTYFEYFDETIICSKRYMLFYKIKQLMK